MVNQYPHTIKVDWSSAPTMDVEGNPVKGTAQIFESNCRAEPNGSGRMIPSADGSLISYAYTVYMPIKEMVLPVGAKVTLNLYGREVKATVKQFNRNFFNVRLWL